MRTTLLSLVALLVAAPASAQIAFVQESSAYVVASGNPLTATVTLPNDVTQGNILICNIGYTDTATRTFVVDGAVQDAAEWVKVVDFGTGRGPEVWVTASHPGGTETITITHGQSSGAFAAACTEFSWPSSTIGVVAFASYTDPAITDGHFSADSEGVSGEGLLLGYSIGVVTGGVVTSTSAGMGWTKTPNVASTGRVSQYQIFEDGVTGERGSWISAGTDRIAESVIVLLNGEGSSPATVRCCGYLLRGWIP